MALASEASESRHSKNKFYLGACAKVIYQKPAVDIWPHEPSKVVEDSNLLPFVTFQLAFAFAEEMLPKLLLQVLKPGGIFCACEQAGRCQDGVDLLPLFWEQMELLGFHLLLKDAKQMEARDEKYLLFKFVLRT